MIVFVPYKNVTRTWEGGF